MLYLGYVCVNGLYGRVDVFCNFAGHGNGILFVGDGACTNSCDELVYVLRNFLVSVDYRVFGI